MLRTSRWSRSIDRASLTERRRATQARATPAKCSRSSSSRPRPRRSPWASRSFWPCTAFVAPFGRTTRICSKTEKRRKPTPMLSLFSAKDYALIAVILGMPLLGAFVNGVWGKRLGKPAVKLMALAAVGVSFVAAVIAFIALAQVVSEDRDGKLSWNAWEWMHTTGGSDGGNVPIAFKFSIDQLSGVMMLIVTGVGFLIHLYASSYMAEDKGYARFFAYMNLFIFS